MTTALIYPLLIAIGTASGLAAGRASLTLESRGWLSVRLHLRKFLFSLGLAPSVLLAGLLGGAFTTSAPHAALPWLMSAAVIPYVIAYAVSRHSREVGRPSESVFPYEEWYSLRLKDPDEASAFLNALWDALAAERARLVSVRSVDRPSFTDLRSVVDAQLADMTAAENHLRRVHGGEAAFPAALASLQGLAQRLRNDGASLLPRD